MTGCAPADPVPVGFGVHDRLPRHGRRTRALSSREQRSNVLCAVHTSFAPDARSNSVAIRPSEGASQPWTWSHRAPSRQPKQTGHRPQGPEAVRQRAQTGAANGPRRRLSDRGRRRTRRRSSHPARAGTRWSRAVATVTGMPRPARAAARNPVYVGDAPASALFDDQHTVPPQGSRGSFSSISRTVANPRGRRHPANGYPTADEARRDLAGGGDQATPVYDGPSQAADAGRRSADPGHRRPAAGAGRVRADHDRHRLPGRADQAFFGDGARHEVRSTTSARTSRSGPWALSLIDGLNDQLPGDERRHPHGHGHAALLDRHRRKEARPRRSPPTGVTSRSHSA